MAKSKLVAPVKVRTGDNRPNGKATKKKPKINVKNGRSCCGYSITRKDRLGHEDGHKKVLLAA